MSPTDTIKPSYIGDIVMTRDKCVDCNKSFTSLPHREYTHVCEQCTIERNADMERWYGEQEEYTEWQQDQDCQRYNEPD
jgi:hypothetical protein